MGVLNLIVLLAALSLLGQAAAADDGRGAIADCDRMTASFTDQDRPAAVAKIDDDKVEAQTAILVCRAALPAASAASGPQAVIELRRVQFELGRALSSAKAHAEARTWYEKAAAAGSTAAMINLGDLYRDGKGVGKDEAAARAWFEKAATAGNAYGLLSLGFLSMSSSDDAAAARAWAEKAGAASRGDGEVMLLVGVMYSILSDGDVDDDVAAQVDRAASRGWFEKAAAAGNAPAMEGLGNLYRDGRGVAQNYAAARAWYEKAVAAGNGNAALLLGAFYELGLGVTKDLAAARAWYEKAGKLDREAEAQKALDRIKAASR